MANTTATESRNLKKIAAGPFSYTREGRVISQRTYIPGRLGYIQASYWDAFQALQAALGEGR